MAFAALIIFIVSIATAIYPLKQLTEHHAINHNDSFELGDALASGIFLGIAFFHMLPSAIAVFQQLLITRYPIAEVICIASFCFLLFLERLSLDKKLSTHANIIPYTLAIILIIHSLTEGAALGISSTLAEGLVVFVAILAHKSSDSFVLCMILMRYHFPLKHIIAIIAVFSLMTPLGIALGSMIHAYTTSFNGQLAQASFDAFAAGTFLYIATLHHLRFHQRLEEAQSLLEFFFMLIGVSVMGVVALIV